MQSGQNFTEMIAFQQTPGGLQDSATLVPLAARVSETDQEYFLLLSAPGLDRQDFRIWLQEQRIYVSARRETGQDQRANGLAENAEIAWEQSFALPEDADSLMALASYRCGELLIRIPRSNQGDPGIRVNVHVY